MKESTTPTVTVVVASTRQNRVGRSIADAVADLARETLRADVEILDLRDVDLPFYDEPFPPAQGKYQAHTTLAWADRVEGFDGFIVVTPEYHGGYPATLKNAFDTVWAERNGKPFQLVAYGWHGGRTVAKQLPTVIGRLKGELVEPCVNVTACGAVRDDDGQIADPAALVGRHRDELQRGFEAVQAPSRAEAEARDGTEEATPWSG